MGLAGQAADRRRDEGYAMAALLVAMSVMAIMMTVAMPVWKQIAQREKEEELVFRGEQYARAIGLFQRKFANSPPPNFDILVEQRFLRKKYKDPITNDDFAIVLQTQNAPGTTPTGAPGAATPGGIAPSAPAEGATAARGRGAIPTAGGNPPAGSRGGNPAPGSQGGSPRSGTPGSTLPSGGSVGGIIGVTSKSKDKSIRIYKGRTHYNEWQFVYVQQSPTPGAPAPGGRGRGGGPGQPAPINPFGQPSPRGPGVPQPMPPRRPGG